MNIYSRGTGTILIEKRIKDVVYKQTYFFYSMKDAKKAFKQYLKNQIT